MKVIGENKEGYIITATKDEIANLQGLYSYYNNDFRVNVGEDINIQSFYKMGREVQSLHNHNEEMKKAIKCIDEATRIIDFVTKCTESEV